MGRKLRVGFAEIQDGFFAKQLVRNAAQHPPGLAQESGRGSRTHQSPENHSQMGNTCRGNSEAVSPMRVTTGGGKRESFATLLPRLNRRFTRGSWMSSSPSRPFPLLGWTVLFLLSFWTDAIFHAFDWILPREMVASALEWRRANRRRPRSRVAKFACYSFLYGSGRARELTAPDRVKVLPYGPNLRIDHGKNEVLNWIGERRQSSQAKCTLLFVGLTGRERAGQWPWRLLAN